MTWDEKEIYTLVYRVERGWDAKMEIDISLERLSRMCSVREHLGTNVLTRQVSAVPYVSASFKL